jgi:pimeloyl-ACP methyl ester carboxylesterase
MKRVELILGAFGVALLVWGARWIAADRGPMRDVTLDGGPACPAAPVLILEPAGDSPRGSVVIFHGLGANRIIMLTNGQQFAAAGFRAYLVDSPGHGHDTAPFSFAANEACARGLLATLERSGEIAPRRTVLFGHSMGAALVVRLADYFPASATIAVSTAPLVRPHRIPANLLLVAPQFDMPQVLSTERDLASAAGAPRTAPDDFCQLRAVRLLSVRGNSHTSALFDSAGAHIFLRWALDAVGTGRAPDPHLSYRAFAGGWLGLLGILLLFPAAASLTARLLGFPVPATVGARPPQMTLSFFAWIATLVPAAIASARWTPLAALHIYSADYLASLLLLAGIPLAACYGIHEVHQRRSNSSQRTGAASRQRPTHRSWAPALCGAIVGLLAITAAGAWLNWQLVEAWPIPVRWARFALLLLALFPISFAEEHALGDPRALGFFARQARSVLFLLIRGTVWLLLLFSWLSGVSSALLVLLFLAYLAVLSLFQRLGADALWHRTGSALAAAAFSAILGAWFLAAAFPLA